MLMDYPQYDSEPLATSGPEHEIPTSTNPQALIETELQEPGNLGCGFRVQPNCKHLPNQHVRQARNCPEDVD